MKRRQSAARRLVTTALALFAGAALAAPASAQGRTLLVPGQYPTIQAAIVAAVNTDTVLVAPGTYVENLDFLGKAITVVSAGGPTLTTIDGNAAGSVVVFVNNEGLDSVLEGFTITNGSGTRYSMSGGQGVIGGGVFCVYSSPTIRGNRITANAIDGAPLLVGGGGICCYRYASPRIENNVIDFNTVRGGFGGGGGIACHTDCDPKIVGNDIHDNSANGPGLFGGGGIICHFRCDAEITHNRIHRNTTQFGGGMQCNFNSVVTIHDNAIYANTATANGGGIQFFNEDLPVEFVGNTIYGNTTPGSGGGILCNTASIALIRNTIVWGNSAANGAQVSVNGTATLNLDFCDVEGGQPAVHVDPTATLNWGQGMLALDPLFKGASSGDFTLLSSSPCVDTGDFSTRFCLSLDLVGNPRFLDGRLDGAMLVDIGACEYDNVRLEILGTSTPGGTVSFVTSGRANLQVYLAMAEARGQLCLPPLGGLFVDPSRIIIAADWGTIPSTVAVNIPANFPTPTDLVFQEVALDPLTMFGNTSNVVELTVR